MQSNMIWAYLIHLSSNMWGDPDSNEKYSRYHSHLITSDSIWQQVTSFLPSRGINTLVIDLGDAVQYESHPEIAVKGAWSKQRLHDELARIRALGMTPIPKLNFSAGHDAWLGKYSRMVATPEYYQVCKDLIAETVELFDHPSLFHLGMDEEDYANQRKYRLCVIRNDTLWWQDAHYFFDLCEKAGARPWVWADRYWSFPEDYLAHMPTSVLQSNWFYWPITRRPDGSYEKIGMAAYEALDRAGYDQVLTSSTWNFAHNSLETIQLGRDTLSAARVKGYMTAPWVFTTEEEQYALLNDAQRFWYARKQVYPETL